jgi:hypothetical protein
VQRTQLALLRLAPGLLAVGRRKLPGTAVMPPSPPYASSHLAPELLHLPLKLLCLAPELMHLPPGLLCLAPEPLHP